MLALIAFAAVTQSADSLARSTGARNPAYAADGRLALAIRGDIWIREGTRWTQLTSGPAWDRQPAWAPDGKSVIYTSTTGGGRLYRVTPGETPQRVTSNDAEEMEASVAPDGSIAYVKRAASSTKIFVRKPDGTEKRLTRGDNGAEHSPAWSPDGGKVAYDVQREDRIRVRVKYVAGDSDRVVVEDRDAEHPAWSPAGDRIVFSTRGGRAGVWVTTPDARYLNFVSAQRAEAAWSPDGTTLALAELPPPEPGYNGDPNRLGDRDVRDEFSASGRLWFIAAPAAPASAVASPLPEGDRAKRNADVMASFWSRMDSLYFHDSPTRHAKWESLRATFMDRARGAKDDDALQQVMHSALRERPTLRDPAVGKMAVSSANPVATAAGLEILRKGGNVVDAAVAVSLTLGVVEPDASGLGGYGQMLVRLTDMEKPQLIEFMTRVPSAASIDNGELLVRGSLPPDGPVLANVPGTLAGMELAWKKWGSRKVKWAEIVAPAIRAAEQGYMVTEGLATTLATEREHFMKYPSSRALFFPKGEPLHAGDSLKNPDLARTLKAIADSGAQTFYSGDVGRRMVADLRGQGNAMRIADLRNYYAAERDAVSGTYRGYTLYSSAPPVSGGATLVAQLNLLEQQKATKEYTEDAASLHAILEAWKLVPRARIADPGLWPVNITAMTSKDTARYRWRCFDPRRALQPNDIRGDSLACAKPAPAATRSERGEGLDLGVVLSSGESVVLSGSEGPASKINVALNNEHSPCSDYSRYESGQFCHQTGTTGFTVADADGNIVSVTQTLGTWGGNFYVSPGLGFIYNDKLGSYGTDPESYGSRLPGARHGSTLAPTIVLRDNKPVMSTSAAGNNWITSAVFSTIVGVLDAKLDAQHAIELPRFTVGQQRNETRPEYQMQIEDGFSPAVLRELEAMGHRFVRISLPGEVREGYAATITFDGKEIMAAADPRRAGAAGAIGCSKDDGSGCHP